MADNTIKIELVDAGTKGGGSSSSAGTPPPLPKGKKAGGKGDGGGEGDIVGAIMDKMGMGGMMKDAKAAGGGLGGMAKAAGVVGVALMGIEAVTSALNGMTKAVNKVTDAAVGAVANDFSGFGAAARGEAVASAMESVPIVGEMAAAQMRLQTAIITLPDKISDAFIQRAGVIGKYSGNISAAQAGADVRSLMGDIREAQTLGPGMARMIDAQSRTQEEIRELLLPIKKFVVDILASRLEFIADAIEIARIAPKLLEELFERYSEKLFLLVTGANADFIAEHQKTTDQAVEKIIRDGLRKGDPEDLFNVFFNDLQGANQMAQQGFGGFAG